MWRKYVTPSGRIYVAYLKCTEPPVFLFSLQFEKVLDKWETMYPVDFVTIDILRLESSRIGTIPDTATASSAPIPNESLMRSFIYVGESVATTAAGRAQDDEKVKPLPSKLGRFLSVLAEIGLFDSFGGAFDISPLRFGLSSADRSENLTAINYQLWEVEQSLISIVGRELCLNSAFGGSSFVPRTLNPDIDRVMGAVQALHKTSPIPADSVDNNEATGKMQADVALMLSNAWKVAKVQKQIPISKGALELAIQAASQSTLLPDGTTVSAMIGKDIPVRDAFNSIFSWYGQLAGSTALACRWAAEAVWRKVNSPRDITGGDTSTSTDSNGLDDRKTTTICDMASGPLRNLSPTQIKHIHGPFLDFWSVCIRHELV